MRVEKKANDDSVFAYLYLTEKEILEYGLEPTNYESRIYDYINLPYRDYRDDKAEPGEHLVAAYGAAVKMPDNPYELSKEFSDTAQVAFYTRPGWDESNDKGKEDVDYLPTYLHYRLFNEFLTVKDWEGDRISVDEIDKRDILKESVYIHDNLEKLSDILSSGQSQTINNKDLGEISVDKGKLGKGGYGILHIIEDRSIRDKLNNDEVTAILYRVVNAAEEGNIVKTQPKIIDGKDFGRIGIEKNGIIAFVSKTRGEKDEKFVITGFGMDEKREEAAEAIKTVIANYGYTPEFSDIRKQVGAVVSSLDKISHKSEEKSSVEIETARKAGYIQGVCECVAAIGEDHILGKKLLTEMNVTKDMAKKFANPKTYNALEQGIFAPRQKLEQTQSIKL